MAKICHMTNAHSRYDIRIFEKECKSLAKENELYLVVSDKICDEIIDGVNIVSVNYEPKNRIERMIVANYKVYKMANKINCQYYQIHDPEMLIFALALKLKGKVVIFDSHENVPGQILSKAWIPLKIRSFISKGYKLFETFVSGKIDAVITATPYIESLFKSRAKIVCNVNNYPKLDDIKFQDLPFDTRTGSLCYVGGISVIRGEKEMTNLANSLKVDLTIAGDCFKEYANEHSNQYIKYVGVLDRNGINELYGKSRLGLVLLHPTMNYLDSLPVKMFEYMAAGLPFIASDFPLWKEITDKYKCGICVDPFDEDLLNIKCKELLSNNKKLEQMGKNGRQAIIENYNWEMEEKKLIDLYNSLREGK